MSPFYKLLKLVLKYLYQFVWGYFFLYAIILIKPILLVRIGELESRAIGHFSLSVEIYLSELDRGIYDCKSRHIDLFFINRKKCNDVLVKKWKSFFRFLPALLLKPTFLLLLEFDSHREHLVPFRHWKIYSLASGYWQNCDIHDVLPKTRPHLKFTEQEHYAASQQAFSMGISPGDKLICFHARDPSYRSGSDAPFSFRDSSINLQVQAMLELAELGYKVVRVGKRVLEHLDCNHPNVIDYANTNIRSDLMDLYLISRCSFMVGTGSGIDAVASVFRIPVIYVNLADWGYLDQYSEWLWPLFIPKKLCWKSSGALLTFNEIYKLDLHCATHDSLYSEAGVDYLSNSPVEIADLVLEAEARLSGVWLDTQEDIILQERFKRSLKPRFPGARVLSSRIGAKFLRQHAYLLD
ncbi:MAG: TIGR04372 family glycosyltransferase [Spirulina sp. SIO3F2]|nr:TIGR04372 family glycosyltransferase [Spirulina sp. SIO3F2]